MLMFTIIMFTIKIMFTIMTMFATIMFKIFNSSTFSMNIPELPIQAVAVTDADVHNDNVHNHDYVQKIMFTIIIFKMFFSVHFQ